MPTFSTAYFGAERRGFGLGERQVVAVDRGRWRTVLWPRQSHENIAVDGEAKRWPFPIDAAVLHHRNRGGTMRCRLIPVFAALAFFGAAGCQRGESEAEIQARRAAAQADSVQMAEDMYDASVFDTITWESPQLRLERGAVVYRSSCGKCHGPNGGGNGDEAMQHQIAVPSFLAPDWQYAGDVAAIRHATFVGHVGMMPEWGLVGLKYKDVDAVAAYIAVTLAPGSSQGR